MARTEEGDNVTMSQPLAGLLAKHWHSTSGLLLKHGGAFSQTEELCCDVRAPLPLA